jgi:CheY-like chemotaxis protein
MSASRWFMKLLIVEDNLSLAEITAELLHCPDRNAQIIEAITLASELQTAILCLPEHDAVLCDGMLPLTPDSHFVVKDWDMVLQEANRRGIHFVLCSGSVRALDCAHESDTPALTKPAAIEEIYAALAPQRLSCRSKTHGEAARRGGFLKNRRGEHVPNLGRLLPQITDRS